MIGVDYQTGAVLDGVAISLASHRTAFSQQSTHSQDQGLPSLSLSLSLSLPHPKNPSKHPTPFVCVCKCTGLQPCRDDVGARLVPLPLQRFHHASPLSLSAHVASLACVTHQRSSNLECGIHTQGINKLQRMQHSRSVLTKVTVRPTLSSSPYILALC